MTSRRFAMLGIVVILTLGFMGVIAYRVRPLPAAAAPTASTEWATLGSYLQGLPHGLVRTSSGHEISVGSGRDPFGAPVLLESARPGSQPSRSAPGPMPAKGSTWVVTAILIAESRRTAVVNDAVVGVGSMLPDGARILSIEEGAVTLQDSTGRTHTIRVRPGTE